MSVQQPVKTSLPALPASIPPDLRMYLERVREELSRVQSGSSSSTTTINNGGGGGTTPPPGTLPCGAPVTPTVPTGVSAIGSFAGYLVSWDLPTYCGHSHTEIYGSKDSNVLGSEIFLGTSGGTTFSLYEPEPNVRRCFWVRHVNLLGEKSSFNATQGACAVTILDPGYLIDVLTGQITRSQLYKDLGEQIDLIPFLKSGFTDFRIANENMTQEVSQVAAIAGGAGAGVTEIKTARIGYCTITATGETTLHKDKFECEAAGSCTVGGVYRPDLYTQALCVAAKPVAGVWTAGVSAPRQWNVGLPWASAVTQVAIRSSDKCYIDGKLEVGSPPYTKGTCEAKVGVDKRHGLWVPGATAVLEQLMEAQQTTDGMLRAQYTLKIDIGGHIAGFGLAVEDPKDGDPTSAFGVRADQFWVAPPTTASATAPTTGNYKGRVWLSTVDKKVYYYAKDVAGVTDGWYNDTKYAAIPFIIQTGERVIDGITVPAGVYMDSAFVRTLSANKITAGSIGVQQCIGSTNFSQGPGLYQGWQICGNGAATFANITILAPDGSVLLSSGSGLSAPGNNRVPDSQVTKIANAPPEDDNWEATQDVGSTSTLALAINPAWPVNPPGTNAIVLTKSGVAGSNVLLSSRRFAVDVGTRYEAFGYVASQNCAATLRVYWYNKDDGFAGYTDLPWRNGLTPLQVPYCSVGGVRNPAYTTKALCEAATPTAGVWKDLNELGSWARGEGFIAPPTGAMYARIKVLTGGFVSGTSAKVALLRPFFGPAAAGQDFYSPWSPTYFSPIIPGNRSTYIRDATIDTAAIKDLSADKITAGNIAAKEYVSIGQDVAPVAGVGARNAGLYLDGPSRALWVRSGSGTSYNTRVRLGYIKTVGSTPKYGLFVRDENNVVAISTCGTEGLDPTVERDGNGDPIDNTIKTCYIDSAYIRNLKTSSFGTNAVTVMNYGQDDVLHTVATGSGVVSGAATALAMAAANNSGVLVTAGANIGPGGAYSVGGQVQLLKNGGLVKGCNYWLSGASEVTVFWMDTAPAAANTYSVQVTATVARNSSGAPVAGTCNVFNSSISALGGKR